MISDPVLLADFVHPGLIAAGAAAAVPVIIHWLNRRRVRPQPWAAMAWLLAALKKQQRRLKLENWLILLLRCLALLVLGTSLARWVVSDSPLAALAPQRTVVLLLDTSYSTSARDGARAVSDRVREAADRLLSNLGADDVCAVVASNDQRPDRPGTRPQVLVPRGVGREAATRARAVVAGVHPTEAPAPWADALAACAPKSLLQEQDGNRVLYWVTDLQATDWRPPANRAGADPLRDAVEALRRAGVELRVKDVGGRGEGSLGNLVVSDVRLSETEDVFVGRPLRVVADVYDFGPRRVVNANVRVFLDDRASPAKSKLQTLERADPAAEHPRPTSVELVIPQDQAPKTPGVHSIRVEVSPPESDASSDALGLDSRRVLALSVRARLRIVAWVEPAAGSQRDPGQFLQGLFQGDAGSGAGDIYEYVPVRNEDELRRAIGDRLHPAGFVVLGNRVPRGQALERDLARFVREGGAVAVFAGADFDETVWNAAFSKSSTERLLPYRFGPREARDRAHDAAVVLDFDRTSAHPMSKSFARGGKNAFVGENRIGPRIWGRSRLLPPEAQPPTGAPPPAQNPADDLVVLRFREADGATAGPAAVVEGPVGLGRVLYSGIALDDLWTSEGWIFLPVLLEEAALSMTRTSTAGRNLFVGGSLRASLPKDASSPRLAIPGRGEESLIVRPASSEDERPEVLFDRIGTSGVWKLTYERPPDRSSSGPLAQKEEQAFGVNVDPIEGNLAKATHAEVRGRVPGADLDVSTALDTQAAEAPARREGELTRWLLFLVLAVLILEPWLAMRFGRHDSRVVAGAAASAKGDTPTGGAS